MLVIKEIFLHSLDPCMGQVRGLDGGSGLVTESRLTLCDLMGCSPPDSSVYEIFQARILEWVAISFSRGIFPIQGLNTRPLCLLHWQAGPLRLGPLGKPFYVEQCISVNPQTFIYPLIPFPFCNHTFVFDILTQFFF